MISLQHYILYEILNNMVYSYTFICIKSGLMHCIIFLCIKNYSFEYYLNYVWENWKFQVPHWWQFMQKSHRSKRINKIERNPHDETPRYSTARGPTTRLLQIQISSFQIVWKLENPILNKESKKGRKSGDFGSKKAKQDGEDEKEKKKRKERE